MVAGAWRLWKHRQTGPRRQQGWRRRQIRWQCRKRRLLPALTRLSPTTPHHTTTGPLQFFLKQYLISWASHSYTIMFMYIVIVKKQKNVRPPLGLINNWRRRSSWTFTPPAASGDTPFAPIFCVWFCICKFFTKMKSYTILMKYQNYDHFKFSVRASRTAYRSYWV